MKHVRSYESYKKHKLVQEDFNKKILILKDIDLDSNQEVFFMDVFEKLLNNSKYNESIKSEIAIYIESEKINENFFDKLKERFPKAAEVSKLLSDKAEVALGNIISKVKDIVSFVTKISDGIKEIFIMMIEAGKKFFLEQLKIGKLKDKLEELKKSKKEGLVKEIKLIKDVLGFYRRGFIDKLSSKIKTNLSSFFNNEHEPVVEALLLEKGNVIATLIHKIEEIPPFSLLHKIASSSEKGANLLIETMSEFTQAMGGPEFQLPVVALLVGLSIEYMVKSTTGHWLLELTGPTPLGMAIKGIKITATFIALISALDGILGTEFLAGGHNDDKHAAMSDDENISDPNYKKPEVKVETDANKEEEI